jgi:hypothetical protein
LSNDSPIWASLTISSGTHGERVADHADKVIKQVA